jgi:hypothetical protein
MRAVLFAVLAGAVCAGAWLLLHGASKPREGIYCLERTLRDVKECENDLPLYGVGLQEYEAMILPQ